MAARSGLPTFRPSCSTDTQLARSAAVGQQRDPLACCSSFTDFRPVGDAGPLPKNSLLKVHRYPSDGLEPDIRPPISSHF